MAHAHHGVPQKARMGVLVVGREAEAAHEVADGADNALGLLVLDEAAVGGHDAVRSGGVHAAEYLARAAPRRGPRPARTVPRAPTRAFSPAVPRPAAGQPAARRVGRDHLVAVVVGLLHAQDGPQRLCGATSANSAATRASLRRQLLGVRLAHMLARSARCSTGHERPPPRTQFGGAPALRPRAPPHALRPTRATRFARASPRARAAFARPALASGRRLLVPLFSTRHAILIRARPKLHYSIRTERIPASRKEGFHHDQVHQRHRPPPRQVHGGGHHLGPRAGQARLRAGDASSTTTTSRPSSSAAWK